MSYSVLYPPTDGGSAVYAANAKRLLLLFSLLDMRMDVCISMCIGMCVDMCMGEQ